MIKFEITKCENPKCFCNSNMFWLSVYFGIPHELRIGFSNSLKTDVRIFIGVSWTPQSNFSSMCTITILIICFPAQLVWRFPVKCWTEEARMSLWEEKHLGCQYGLWCWGGLVTRGHHYVQVYTVYASLLQSYFYHERHLMLFPHWLRMLFLHLLRGSLIFIFPSANMSIFVCIDPSFMPGEYPNPSGWVILLMWCWILLAMNFWEQF